MTSVYFTSIRVGGGSSRRNREAIQHTLLSSVQDNEEVERRILLETEITERQQIVIAFLQQPTLTALRKVHDELRAPQEYRLRLAAKAARLRRRQLANLMERHEERAARRSERKREEAVEAAARREYKREKRDRQRAKAERQQLRRSEDEELSNNSPTDSVEELSSATSSVSSDTTSSSPPSHMGTFSTSPSSFSSSEGDTSETDFEATTSDSSDESSNSSSGTTSSPSSGQSNSTDSSMVLRRERRLEKREARQQRVRGPRLRELQAVPDRMRGALPLGGSTDGKRVKWQGGVETISETFPHMVGLTGAEAVEVYKLLWSDIESQVMLAVEQRKRRREEEMANIQRERARYSGTAPTTPTEVRPTGAPETTHTSSTTDRPTEHPSVVGKSPTLLPTNARVKLLELRSKGRWEADTDTLQLTPTANVPQKNGVRPPSQTGLNEDTSTLHSDPHRNVNRPAEFAILASGSIPNTSLRTRLESINAMLDQLHTANNVAVDTSAEIIMAQRRIAKGPSHAALRKDLITGLRTSAASTTGPSSSHRHSSVTASAAIASDVFTGGGGIASGNSKLRDDTLKAIRRRVMDEIKVDMDEQRHPSATGVFDGDAAGTESGTLTKFGMATVGVVSDILRAKEEEHRQLVALLAEQSPIKNRASGSSGGGTQTPNDRRTSSARSLGSVAPTIPSVTLLQNLNRATPRESFATTTKKLSESVYALYKIWGLRYQKIRVSENERLMGSAKAAAEAETPQKHLWYKGTGERKNIEATKAAVRRALESTTPTSSLFTTFMCDLLSFTDPLSHTSLHHHELDETNNTHQGGHPSPSSLKFYQQQPQQQLFTRVSNEEGTTPLAGEGETVELGVTLLHEASQVMTEFPLAEGGPTTISLGSPKAAPFTMTANLSASFRSGGDATKSTTFADGGGDCLVQLLDENVSSACSYTTFQSLLKTLASILYPERSLAVASQLLAAMLVRRSHIL